MGMIAYFGHYVQDDVDATVEYVGTAAVRCAHVVCEPADNTALSSVLSLIQDEHIGRVEFIHRPRCDAIGYKEYRGAVLYRGVEALPPTPFVHVLNALLGYDGSGPMLSRRIMEHLGMPESMFDRMNDQLKDIRSSGESYLVVARNEGGTWNYEQVSDPYPAKAG